MSGSTSSVRVATEPRLIASYSANTRRLDVAIVAVAAAVSVVYVLVTGYFAARKLMWNDELYTYYVAILPTMRDVWGALSAGGEQTPPLFYAITRASMAMFGSGGLALRLPELIGFWVMGACLYVFVGRRSSAPAALLAAVVPLVTSAYMYAFEARSYALELGCAAAALVCWQSVRIGRHRALWIAALTVSLAATLSSHYYGIFLLAGLGAGELVRTIERRRIDVLVWVSFALAVVPLILQLPILRAGAAYTGTFWSPPQWVNIPDFYQDLLWPAVVPIAAIMAVSFAWSLFAPPALSSAADPRTTPPLADLAAAAGIALVPVFAVVAAKFATGAFVNRYALIAVIGVAVLVGHGAGWAFRRVAALQWAAIAIVVSWFALGSARELVQPTGVSMPVSPAAIARPTGWLAAAGRPELPVVIAEPHSFALLSHYGDPALKHRVVYIADPARALKRLGTNSVERGMLDLLGPWFHMNVVPFDHYVPQHEQFFVYGNFVRLSFLNWVVPELQDRGYRIELLDRAGDDMLLLASRDRHN